MGPCGLRLGVSRAAGELQSIDEKLPPVKDSDIIDKTKDLKTLNFSKCIQSSLFFGFLLRNKDHNHERRVVLLFLLLP